MLLWSTICKPVSHQSLRITFIISDWYYKCNPGPWNNIISMCLSCNTAQFDNLTNQFDQALWFPTYFFIAMGEYLLNGCQIVVTWLLSHWPPLLFGLMVKGLLWARAHLLDLLIPYRFEIWVVSILCFRLSCLVGKTTRASVTDECVYSGPATAQVACPLLHRKSESKLRSTPLTRHTVEMQEEKIFV